MMRHTIAPRSQSIDIPLCISIYAQDTTRTAEFFGAFRRNHVRSLSIGSVYRVLQFPSAFPFARVPGQSSFGWFPPRKHTFPADPWLYIVFFLSPYSSFLQNIQLVFLLDGDGARYRYSLPFGISITMIDCQLIEHEKVRQKKYYT